MDKSIDTDKSCDIIEAVDGDTGARMILMERLADGVLFVQNGRDSGYQASFEQLAKPIQDKYLLLAATDVGVRIEDVGSHVSENKFWIMTDADKGKDVNTAMYELRGRLLANGVSNALAQDVTSALAEFAKTLF